MKPTKTSRSAIEEAQTQRAEATRTESSESTRTLGLVPSYGLPVDIANGIADTLVEELCDNVDDAINWQVEVVPDPITGSDVGSPELLDAIAAMAEAGSWDYVIAMTDLPVRRDGAVVIADVSTERKVGWISIPALGVFRIGNKTRELISLIVEDLHHGPEDRKVGKIARHVERAPVDEADDNAIDTHFVGRGPLATGRLLDGMVYANKPWSILPSLRTTAVTTVATGSYGLIFSSMWELGEFSESLRLFILMLAAVSLLTLWIIVSHQLWRPHTGSGSTYIASVYNASTLVTVGAGVMIAYALVYLVLLLESILFMPPSLLEYRLEEPVDWSNWATAAWVTSSIATLAGALGAGLEDTERVRQATFSWRAQRRFEEVEEEDQEEREQDPDRPPDGNDRQ